MKEDDLVRVLTRGISMIFQDPTAALNPVFSIGEQIENVIKIFRPTQVSLSASKRFTGGL